MKNTISSEIYESVKMGRLIKTHGKKNSVFQNYVLEARAGGKRFIKCGQKNGFNYCDFLSRTKKTQYRKQNISRISTRLFKIKLSSVTFAVNKTQ